MDFESTQKIKILFTGRFNYGGGFIYTHYLCNMLAELGCDVTCIYLKERFIGDKPLILTDARYKVVWLNTFLAIQPWQLKRFIGSYLKKTAPDVIASTGSEGVYLQDLCSKRGIPHIASYHNSDPSYKVSMRDLFRLKWLNPFNFGEWSRHLYIYFEWQRLKKADLVHCISEWQKDTTCRHLNIPENRIVVIYGGVDLKEFSPAPDISKSGILYCGRLVRDKGIDNLLEAFSIVRKRHKLPLTIVGPGDWQSYRQKAVRLGIDKDIDYIGYVPRKDVSSYFKKACLFVTPAQSEGFGLTVAEASASGLPVIATLSSAIPEIVKDGVTGILIPWNDSNALANAIITLLDNPGLARSMGEKGRIYVESKFGWEQTARNFIKCIISFRLKESR